ncbi:MAG: PhzF family phenazine biosynthesis isomerase [Chloroflexi bacterium]|nr:PhzF family phenazine biosynthesis isomerase [Chloroflexota bacterium]
MRELAYYLVDVFTDTIFGGNQLAVFTEPPVDLPGATMQSIARELKLSETVFVLPPADAANHYRLRIFTPGSELPFAGHPTIGTGFVLHQAGMVPPGNVLRLEEGVGLIEVTLTHEVGGKLLVTMQQPIPQFGAIYADRAQVSAALSLSLDDLLPDYPVQIVSSGNPFLFVPLKSLDAVARSRARIDVYEQVIAAIGARGLFLFAPGGELPGTTVHARMYAPQMGITEDPATGSAAGPLGAYLLHYGLVDAAAAQHIVCEQGFEMKRPSIIHISVQGTAAQITGASIGGYTQSVGSGVLRVE